MPAGKNVDSHTRTHIHIFTSLCCGIRIQTVKLLWQEADVSWLRVCLSSWGVFGLLRFVGKILSLSWQIESVHEQSIVFTSDMKWSGGILLDGVWSSCSWLWTCRWRTQVNPQVLAALAFRLCCLISVAVRIKRCAVWDCGIELMLCESVWRCVWQLCFRVWQTQCGVCVNVCDAVWLCVVLFMAW